MRKPLKLKTTVFDSRLQTLDSKLNLLNPAAGDLFMQMRARLEALIDEMLDGQIMLDEALNEFEKLYIQKALARHKDHLSRTATTLGIHRNTLSKRVAAYRSLERVAIRQSRKAKGARHK